MIAPKNFAADVELFHYLTDRVIQNFGIEAKALPKGKNLDLRSQRSKIRKIPTFQGILH